MEGTKPCKGCGLVRPFADYYRDRSRTDGYGRICKDCNRAKNKAWYAANGERSREAARRWQQENATRRAEYDRVKYLVNRKKIDDRTQEWVKRNRGRRAAIQAKSQRRASELATRRIRQANRRAAKLTFPPIPESLLAARVAYFGGRCWICREAPFEHLDHVKPLSAGGPHLLSNIRPACAACNIRKGSQWPYDVGASLAS